MKVIINRGIKGVKIDCSEGTMGAVTTAGQVMQQLAKDHAKAIAGWDFSFYPEEGGGCEDFTDATEINSFGWSGAALEIAALLLNDTCSKCGQVIP